MWGSGQCPPNTPGQAGVLPLEGPRFPEGLGQRRAGLSWELPVIVIVEGPRVVAAAGANLVLNRHGLAVLVSAGGILQAATAPPTPLSTPHPSLHTPPLSLHPTSLDRKSVV